MKKFWIVCLVMALVFVLAGCMRGGNIDKGRDGMIGDLEDEGDGVIRDVENGLKDAKDNMDDKIDDITPDNGDDVRRNREDLPNVEDGIIDDNGGMYGLTPDIPRNDNGTPKYMEPYGVWPNPDAGNGTNDNGNSSVAGGGLNGSGNTANGGNTVDGNHAIPRGTIR